MVMQIKALIPQ